MLRNVRSTGQARVEGMRLASIITDAIDAACLLLGSGHVRSHASRVRKLKEDLKSSYPECAERVGLEATQVTRSVIHGDDFSVTEAVTVVGHLTKTNADELWKTFTHAVTKEVKNDFPGKSHEGQ